MPLLSKVQRTDKTRDLVVTIPPDPDDPESEPMDIKVSVYPNRITLGTAQRARELGEDDLLGIAGLFFGFLHSWDLQGDDNKPLPFTDATAKLLTPQTFQTLTQAVMEAVRPNLTTSDS